MEKHTLISGDAENTALSPARASRATTKRFAIAVLVAALLPLAYLFPHPLSHLLHGASCHRFLGRLTIEQRAQKILRENPLIGQPGPRSHIETDTDFAHRRPQ